MTTTEMFRRIIATCAKVSAAGVATTDDMNMLAREGYPLWGSLIDLIGDNAHEVRESVARGELEASLFIAALHNAIGHSGEAPMTTPHIIRDPDDLNDYDVDTLILDASGDCSTVEDFASSLHDWPEYVHSLPAVVIATGEQVRAARKALEEQA